MKAAIIIPVYNHALHVGEVIEQALALRLPLIVVNDGSTDTTPALLEEMARRRPGITLLHHPDNQGKGAAICTGFAAAMGLGCDWALTMDGDGQHRPQDASRLLAAGDNGQRCIIVGTRQGMEAARNVPWTSRFGRHFSNFWVWVAGGPALADSQSGFRLYPLPEAMALPVRARRYQFEVEILVRARLAGIAVREVPVPVVYQERGERVSHFHPWLDFMRNSATFSRLIFARILRGVSRS